MSYDLAFWRYEDNAYSDDHQHVYEQLCEEEPIAGVAELPYADIMRAVHAHFSGWDVNEYNADPADADALKAEIAQRGYTDVYAHPQGKGAFEAYPSRQCVIFSCKGLDYQYMNDLIDILYEFNCPLYDPQTNERFDEDERERKQK